MNQKKLLLMAVALAVLSAVVSFVAKTKMPGGYGTTGVADSSVVDLTDAGSADSKMMIAPDIYPMPPYYGGNDRLDIVNREYQKFSDHQVVVDEVDEYVNDLKNYLLGIDGRILSSSQNVSAKFASAYMMVKVPVAKFDEAVARVKQGIEKLMGESISSQDRTGDVVMISETVEGLKSQMLLLEAELEDAKKNNSGSVTIAKIQQKINGLNRQIEVAQNQADSVTQGVEYASMTIQVADSKSYFLGSDYELSLWEEAKQAFSSLKMSLVSLAKLGVWTAVFTVIWLPIMWLVSMVYRKMMGK